VQQKHKPELNAPRHDLVFANIVERFFGRANWFWQFFRAYRFNPANQSKRHVLCVRKCDCVRVWDKVAEPLQVRTAGRRLLLCRARRVLSKLGLWVDSRVVCRKTGDKLTRGLV
jgi:hypothetical protein